MSKFKNQMMKKIIKPETSSKFSNLVGTVTFYDKEINKASVEIRSAGRATIIQDIPVMLYGRGIISQSIKPGDVVYLSCTNNSLFNAKIIGIADDNPGVSTNYNMQKYNRRGEYLCNIEKIKKDVKIRKGNRSSETSYHDTIFGFSECSVFNALQEVENNMATFKDDDVGIINPTSKSLVKVCDNGIIEIFTSGDTGIKINPAEKIISFFGDVNTNSQKWAVLSNNVQVHSDNINIKSSKINIDVDRLIINGDEISV